jgi:alkyldihydroxyacetonephosphate synthase
MTAAIDYFRTKSVELAAPDIDRLVDALRVVLPADHLVTGEEARRLYPGDQSWLTFIHAHHGKPLNRPDVVVMPRSTEDVSAVMQIASRMEVPVTPIGGASGVQGAANANCGGLQVDLSRMDKVRHLDLMSLTCTVEPGLLVKSFEEWLNEQGLTFTHYPASAEWASIGGSVAARGSGVLSTKYGNIQDHVLSLEVVLPDGGIVQLPDVPKHGAGPELTQLFVGSEGVLGIITAVRVKLRKVPVRRSFMAFAFDELAQGIEAGREIMTSGLRPSVMRLYDKDAARNSLERAVEAGLDSETMIIMVDGDHDRMIDIESRLCGEICVAHGGRELSPSVGETWWDRRYAFYHPPFAPELPQIWCTMDAVSDYAHIDKLYSNVTRAIRESVGPEWKLSLKTHLSHWFEWGSMIYPRVGIPRGPDDLDNALELHDRIVRAASMAALESGGVVNDHHGVGMRLAPYMLDQFGKDGMRLLRGIKRGIDPKNILCPGKLDVS